MQTALLELAALLGAAIQPWRADGSEVPAAPVGRRQLRVGTEPELQEQQQLGAVPHVDVQTFLEAAAIKDTSLLQGVVDAHKQQQAAAAADDDGDMTDATDVSDIEEDEEAGESQEQIHLQSLMPLASQRRILLPSPLEPITMAAAGGEAGDGQTAAREQQQATTAIQQVAGRRGKAGTPARGSKRTAAAAAADGDDESPLPAKRRKGASRGAAVAAAAELDGHPASSDGRGSGQPGASPAPIGAVAAAALQAAPGVQPLIAATGAGTAGGPIPAAVVPAATDPPAGVPDGQGVMWVPLVMQQQQQQPHCQGSRPNREHDVAVVNFKAFRRKGQVDQGEPVEAAATGPVVELTSFAPETSGPDAEAFLR